MSAWPGKYVIGLTGNIATGKSVVRKMLEHLGAYGIDADTLGHRVIAAGANGAARGHLDAVVRQAIYKQAGQAVHWVWFAHMDNISISL